MEEMIIRVWFDGACGPKNPGGHAGCGFVIKRTVGYFSNREDILTQQSQYVGFGPTMSNNVAEYAAVTGAMAALIGAKLEKEETIFYGDSKLVVMQMKAKWKAKGGLYIPWYKAAVELLLQFENYDFIWIPREQNTEADELSKKAIKRYL